MRRVYFSFDYARDVHRVKQIYQLPGIVAKAAGSFANAAIWQGARHGGDAQVLGLINDAMMNTSVTVICIGGRTSYGKYLSYEIERSLNQGSGIVGVLINHLRDEDGAIDAEAPIPPQIQQAGFKVYKFTDKKALVQMIDEAAEIAASLQAPAAPPPAEVAVTSAAGGPPPGMPERRMGQRRILRGRRGGDLET